jgi:hypothetical protein
VQDLPLLAQAGELAATGCSSLDLRSWRQKQPINVT